MILFKPQRKKVVSALTSTLNYQESLFEKVMILEKKLIYRVNN